MRNAIQKRSTQGGVMLLEALVAILIFSIGIIAVMGMQAASITQVTQSKFRTDASYLANQILGQIWVDQANMASYSSSGYSARSGWDATVASTLPSGAGDIVVAGRQVTVTVTWKMPDDTVTRKFVAVANINPSDK
jgi:type IV pilus assembly protein PilV